MARILVTGGAGYIGSHTVSVLLEAGHLVTVYDDLSNGHRAALSTEVPLVVASINNERRLAQAFLEFDPEAVIHFAGAIEPSLSASDPSRFYRSNVGGTLALAERAAEWRVPLVFSSSCAIYGTPAVLPVNEDLSPDPVSVYGETKLVGERILTNFGNAYGLRSIALRYFNAAGADPSGMNGADHRLPVHLVTAACRVALGQLPHLSVFGDDYDTADGTCLRDYVHVVDLARAHLHCIEALLTGAPSTAYNVGTGTPYSVREVAAAVSRASGHQVPLEVAPRRSGDPAAVWADARRIRADLAWQPTLSGIDEIAESAWRWHRSHPAGFEGPVRPLAHRR